MNHFASIKKIIFIKIDDNLLHLYFKFDNYILSFNVYCLILTANRFS